MKTIITFDDFVNEKNWIKVDPSKKGMFDGWTEADLEAEKNKLKAKNDEHPGEVSDKDKEKMSQLNFALRAKKGHGFKKKK